MDLCILRKKSPLRCPARKASSDSLSPILVLRPPPSSAVTECGLLCGHWLCLEPHTAVPPSALRALSGLRPVPPFPHLPLPVPASDTQPLLPSGAACVPRRRAVLGTLLPGWQASPPSVLTHRAPDTLGRERGASPENTLPAGRPVLPLTPLPLWASVSPVRQVGTGSG